MQASVVLKLSLAITLLALAVLQNIIGGRQIISHSFVYKKENQEDEDVEITFDMTFPIIKRNVSIDLVSEAEKYMKLPTWSAGYINCTNSSSEVSCYEITRAYNSIKKYEELVKSGKTKGSVLLFTEKYEREDRMSMLYQGLSIAMATDRLVYVRKDLFPFDLPKSIQDLQNSTDIINGFELDTDYRFGCANISNAHPQLIIKNITWPQVMYTHEVVASYLRNNFGFHAAYFLGNYLFGSEEKPLLNCINQFTDYGVEAKKFEDYSVLTPGGFQRYIGRCGATEKILMVTNSQSSIISNNVAEDYKVTDDNTFVCGLRKLVSSKHVIHTFGSRYGWWAMAMHGNKGGFVNSIDFLCINVNVSQSASLWHTYCPRNRDDIFRTNNRLYICGPNSMDVRLYIDYLLW